MKLFRGQVKKGSWVYGYYVCLGNVHLIYTGHVDYDYGENVPEVYEVISKTVGRATGLTDKNGRRIFEGDVVELTDVNNDIKWNAIVVFGNPYGEYCWGWNLMYVGVNPKVNTDILCWVNMEDSGAFIEIIGNIYDNPELIKEQDDAGEYI